MNTNTLAVSEARREKYEHLLTVCAYVAPGAVLPLVGWVRPEHFSDRDCAKFWAGLLKHGDPARAALDASLFEQLQDWRAEVEDVSIAPELARKMAAQAWLSDLARQSVTLAGAVASGDALKAQDIIDGMNATRPANRTELPSIVDAGQRFIEIVDNGVDAVQSGLEDLDRITGGFARKTQVVICARPGMGKTTVGFQIARNVVEQGRRAIFYSIEMGREELFARLACGKAEMPWSLFKANKATPDQKEAIKQLARDLMAFYGTDLRIDDNPQTTASIWESAAAWHPDLIVVDHLQIVGDPPRPGENGASHVGRISWAFKALAKQLNCVVVLLSQLSRQNEQRTNKRPTMADLRESGAIEQNADSIYGLYRPDQYTSLATVKTLVDLELIILKERSGEARKIIPMIYDLRRQEIIPVYRGKQG